MMSCFESILCEILQTKIRNLFYPFNFNKFNMFGQKFTKALLVVLRFLLSLNKVSLLKEEEFKKFTLPI